MNPSAAWYGFVGARGVAPLRYIESKFGREPFPSRTSPHTHTLSAYWRIATGQRSSILDLFYVQLAAFKVVHNHFYRFINGPQVLAHYFDGIGPHGASQFRIRE